MTLMWILRLVLLHTAILAFHPKTLSLIGPIRRHLSKMPKRPATATAEEVDLKRKRTLPFIPVSCDETRIKVLTECTSFPPRSESCVLVWMTRDQRVNDNYTLLCAQDIARAKGVPIRVVFNLVPKFLQATLRQYQFMIDGLAKVETSLKSLNVPFHLTIGDPVENIPIIADNVNAIALITDFSPLRVNSLWTQSVADKLDTQSIPMLQVDSHNVVPIWEASPKLEYGARTIRPKIEKQLSKYLVDFEAFEGNPSLPSNKLSSSEKYSQISPDGTTSIDWSEALNSLQIDRTVAPVTWIASGEDEAMKMLKNFTQERLKIYSNKRNDPNEYAVSNLSSFFHFGQISVQRVALFVKRLKQHPDSTDAFIEEAIVRRELADNFCYYNNRYDSLEGCYEWAKETLRIHSEDKRTVVYTLEEFENAQTHDDLWNAAQLQMVSEGKMHGFLRMYWAKKILEWTNSPQEALEYSIYLNDRYQLDGRDPNGYVGCMWSIGGIHDQGWAERPIFGKIRYMNYKGCERKFDVKGFVSKYPPARANALATQKERGIKPY